MNWDPTDAEGFAKERGKLQNPEVIDAYSKDQWQTFVLHATAERGVRSKSLKMKYGDELREIWFWVTDRKKEIDDQSARL